MYKFVFALIALSLLLPSYSQNIKKVSATYTYIAPADKSLEEAKRIALERAKLQAIADVFGTEISQTNTSIISNTDDKSSNYFFTYGISKIKGDWIENIGNPTFSISYHEDMLVVKCTVNVIAREKSDNATNLTVKTLKNGLSTKFESSEFKSGDDIYLYVKSSTEGYLSALIHDEQSDSIYMILPYVSQSIDALPISADKELIFFSPEKRVDIDFNDVDEYSVVCNKDMEFQTIYIIFSKEKTSPFYSDMPNVLRTNRAILFSAFSKHLSHSLANDSNLQIHTSSIKISPN